jgi:hypothetical protein
MIDGEPLRESLEDAYADRPSLFRGAGDRAMTRFVRSRLKKSQRVPGALGPLCYSVEVARLNDTLASREFGPSI